MITQQTAHSAQRWESDRQRTNCNIKRKKHPKNPAILLDNQNSRGKILVKW